MVRPSDVTVRFHRFVPEKRKCSLVLSNHKSRNSDTVPLPSMYIYRSQHTCLHTMYEGVRKRRHTPVTARQTHSIVFSPQRTLYITLPSSVSSGSRVPLLCPCGAHVPMLCRCGSCWLVFRPRSGGREGRKTTDCVVFSYRQKQRVDLSYVPKNMYTPFTSSGVPSCRCE